MMQSGLYCFASSGLISGSGLAMAKITGSGLRAFRMVSLKAPAADTPIRTSAPTHASSKVVSYVTEALANVILNSFIPACLPGQITPFVSHTKIFAGLAP